MDIKNNDALNVSKQDKVNNISNSKSEKNNNENKNIKTFSEELKNIENVKNNKKEKNSEKSQARCTDNQIKTAKNKKSSDFSEANEGLNNVIDEISKLNQREDIFNIDIKSGSDFDDNLDINKSKNNEGLNLIDNNMNIPEKQDKLEFQMGANMNFDSNGKPFTEFVNQEQFNANSLKSSAKDLAEEKAIMSTMEENIAIANKNLALAKTKNNEPDTKIVENEHGINKINKKTNLIVDTIVSYDRIAMDKADVEFFINLADNGFLDIREIQNTEKSSRVSKALADLLAKAMNDNKPVRIDFDNNISVIIKIDRAGKITADFLPSSQVAEAYLKENLPLLRQRFDDNNIDYNELNQRQRNGDTQDNKKKERKDE